MTLICCLLTSGCGGATLGSLAATSIGCPENELATANMQERGARGARTYVWTATCHGVAHVCSVDSSGSWGWFLDPHVFNTGPARCVP